MNPLSDGRRRNLKRLASLTALGAINALRAPRAFADGNAGRQVVPGVSGKVIARRDADYEIWRQSMVWHMSKPPRYPDLIVQVASTSEVVAAVNHAAANGLKIAMRSGGHNSNGVSLRNGGITLDMSGMNLIDIDTGKNIASIQPGVRSLELVTAAREKGLCFPVPHCPSVGLSGFTLGGGMGWNWPKCGGMSTHSIAGAEVVTGEGKTLRATASENPDLFWAVRGAGPGFFGAVTRLDLKLYPAPRAILASSFIFPLGELAMVASELDAIRAQGGVDGIEIIAVLMHHPQVPFDAPPERSKIVFLTAFAFEENERAARETLRPFAESNLARRAAVKMEYQSFDFEGLYNRYFSLDDPAGRCGRYAVDNVLTNDGGAVLRALAEHLKDAPTKDCHILAAFNLRVETRVDSCFSWAADCFVGCYALWDEERDDAKNFAWLKKTLPLMDPFAVGHYVNEVEVRDNPQRYTQCFSAANWERLRALRRRYDPRGVFHDYLGHS